MLTACYPIFWKMLVALGRCVLLAGLCLAGSALAGAPVIAFSASPSLVGDLEHWQHDTFVARWRRPFMGEEQPADAYVSFALNHRFSGLDSRAFRATNVALLAACGLDGVSDCHPWGGDSARMGALREGDHYEPGKPARPAACAAA